MYVCWATCAGFGGSRIRRGCTGGGGRGGATPRGPLRAASPCLRHLPSGLRPSAHLLRGRRPGAARTCGAPSGHLARPEYRLAPSALESACPCVRLRPSSAAPRVAPPRPPPPVQPRRIRGPSAEHTIGEGTPAEAPHPRPDVRLPRGAGTSRSPFPGCAYGCPRIRHTSPSTRTRECHPRPLTEYLLGLNFVGRTQIPDHTKTFAGELRR